MSADGTRTDGGDGEELGPVEVIPLPPDSAIRWNPRAIPLDLHRATLDVDDGRIRPAPAAEE